MIIVFSTRFKGAFHAPRVFSKRSLRSRAKDLLPFAARILATS